MSIALEDETGAKEFQASQTSLCRKMLGAKETDVLISGVKPITVF